MTTNQIITTKLRAEQVITAALETHGHEPVRWTPPEPDPDVMFVVHVDADRDFVLLVSTHDDTVVITLSMMEPINGDGHPAHAHLSVQNVRPSLLDRLIADYIYAEFPRR